MCNTRIQHPESERACHHSRFPELAALGSCQSCAEYTAKFSGGGLEYVDDPLMELNSGQPPLSSVLETSAGASQHITLQIDAVATEHLSGQGKFHINDLLIR